MEALKRNLSKYEKRKKISTVIPTLHLNWISEMSKLLVTRVIQLINKWKSEDVSPGLPPMPLAPGHASIVRKLCYTQHRDPRGWRWVMVPREPLIEVNAPEKRIEFPFSCLLQSSFSWKEYHNLEGWGVEEIGIRLGTCHMLGAGSHTTSMYFFSSTAHNGVQCWCYYNIL